MSATTVPTLCPGEATATADPPSAVGTSRTATVVASSLWVFVSGLLVYGIVQTAIKAAALFG